MLKTEQLQKQKLKQISIQKPEILSKLKTKTISITVPSLKLKTITILHPPTAPTIPVFPPTLGRLEFDVPFKKISFSLKGKRKRKKSRRKKWEKTLLASPFLVEESYIKFGKATHPKPTKKLWKVGYRTMFKIPTVELMKKGRRKKKGGRKR